MGKGLTRLYGDFFHFPFLIFRHDADVYAIAALVSVLAAVVGALKAVRDVLALAPAVAMQPPAPPRYRKLFLGRLVPLHAVLAAHDHGAAAHRCAGPSAPARPRSASPSASRLLVTALLSFNSVEQMIDVAFFRTDRQHATLNFTDEKHGRALQAVERLPGVLRAEPYRSVSVRLRNGHLSRKLSIVGKPTRDGPLPRPRSRFRAGAAARRPASSISERVAEILHLRRGDVVEVEILEGRRGVRQVPVADVDQELFRPRRLHGHRCARPALIYGPRLTGVHIAYDTRQQGDSVRRDQVDAGDRLDRPAAPRAHPLPRDHRAEHQLLGDHLRDAGRHHRLRRRLQQRAHPAVRARAASWRASGCWASRGREVSRVLLTELALLTLVAIPLGWVIGYGFGWLLIQAFSSDLYRVPFVIEHATYAKASLVVLAATAASALIVRRRVDRLDLIAVLKTRD